MPDIRLVQITDFPRVAVSIDWLLTPLGTLDDTQELATAVIMALGTDRLAGATDILPDPDSTDRKGWWGDLDAEDIWDGWPIGSRLWLLRRDKITDAAASQGSTLARVESYIREALQPFVTKKIASRIDVTAQRNGRDRIDAQVIVYRGPKTAIDLRFQILWD